MKFTVIAVVLTIMTNSATAQLAYSEDQFRAFDAKGSSVTLDRVLAAADEADVLFLGEQHDDAVGHAIQAEVFRRIVEKNAGRRKIVLSLEMFERDVQTVVNEYLAGLITENHFLLSSRPWGNYKTDYRPLVELAKEKKLPVIAANAPRRYVNMVSRGGRSKLDGLSKEARTWLPPLPYSEASAEYAKKFKALMGTSAEAKMGIDNILSSQSFWDASMAYWVAESLKKHKGALVIHLNGSFHTEGRLGTVEHLLKYRPKTKIVVTTMRYEADFKTFDSGKHSNLGDFVILTDATVPRSKR